MYYVYKVKLQSKNKHFNYSVIHEQIYINHEFIYLFLNDHPTEWIIMLVISVLQLNMQNVKALYYVSPSLNSTSILHA